MPKFLVSHERWKCISCGACAAVHPEHWQMSKEDGMADIVGSTKKQVPEGILEEDIVEDPAKAEKDKEAQQTCPVECIHVKEVEEVIQQTQT